MTLARLYTFIVQVSQETELELVDFYLEDGLEKAILQYVHWQVSQETNSWVSRVLLGLVKAIGDLSIDGLEMDIHWWI